MRSSGIFWPPRSAGLEGRGDHARALCPSVRVGPVFEASQGARGTGISWRGMNVLIRDFLAAKVCKARQET